MKYSYSIGVDEFGEPEFGEIYHLLAATILVRKHGDEVSIDFDSHPGGEEFFADLGIALNTTGQAGKSMNLSETTEQILERFDKKSLEFVRVKIDEMAAKEEWALPFSNIGRKGPKVLIWSRKREHNKYRNLNGAGLKQLADTANTVGLTPITIDEPEIVPCTLPLGKYYVHSFYQRHSICKQLWTIDKLVKNYCAVGQIGMMSGAMDGPALFYDTETTFLARQNDAKRMNNLRTKFQNIKHIAIDYRHNFKRFSDSEIEKLGACLEDMKKKTDRWQ